MLLSDGKRENRKSIKEDEYLKKNNIRDTPVIVIPKGYTIDDLMDFDDDGYENGEPAMVEEVKVVFEQ